MPFSTQNGTQPRKGISELYVLFYIAVLLIWPFKEYRFITPIIPFLYMYLFLGVKCISNLVNKKYNLYLSGIGFVLCLTLLFSNFWTMKSIFEFGYINKKIPATLHMTKYLFTKINHISPGHILKGVEHPCRRSFIKLYFWLRENSRDSDIIVGSKPSIGAMISERQFIGIPYLMDGEKIIKFLEDKNVSYIIIDTSYTPIQKYLMPVLEQYPARFQPVIYDKCEYRMIVRFLR